MTHAEALETALTKTRVGSSDQHAALVALCRTLAAQMDAAGSEPSSRLVAAYLSALKDVRRAAVELPPRNEGVTQLDFMRSDIPRPGRPNGAPRAPSKKGGRRGIAG